MMTVSLLDGGHAPIRRLLAAGLALLLLAAVSLVTAPGAHAAGYPILHLRPGDSFSRTYPAIPGSSVAGDQAGRRAGAGNGYPYPENCAKPGNACDTIPIQFDIDPTTIKSHSYFFQAVISWDSGPHVDDPSGNTDGKNQKDDLSTWEWPVPHGKGTDGKLQSGYKSRNFAFTTSPQTIVDGALDGNRVDLVIENYDGANTGYTVRYLFKDTSERTFSDKSVDAGGPVDRSGFDSIPITPSASPAPRAAPTVTPVAVPFNEVVPQTPAPSVGSGDGRTTLGLADPAPDDQLSGIRAGDNLTLGVDKAKKINRVERGPGPARPVGALTAIVWLAAVPGGVLLIVLGLLARRRANCLVV